MAQENTAQMESQEILDSTGNQTITIGEWVLTLFISFIPLVNIIMLFVWGFGGNAPEAKANWAKAMLIWIAIIIGLNILFGLILGASFLTAFA